MNKQLVAAASGALAHDPRIIAAVEELARQRLTLDVPQALDTLRSAMSDKFSKDKVRAATALLDRVLPSKQELTVKAEPTRPSAATRASWCPLSPQNSGQRLKN